MKDLYQTARDEISKKDKIINDLKEFIINGDYKNCEENYLLKDVFSNSDFRRMRKRQLFESGTIDREFSKLKKLKTRHENLRKQLLDIEQNQEEDSKKLTNLMVKYVRVSQKNRRERFRS